MRVLGIETSCDDTGVAIFDSDHGLLAHGLHSQTELHQQYGGVVPELASRDHIRKIAPLVEHILQQAGLEAEQLDGVAYTAGPGLIGALLVGATFAASYGFALNIPTLAIHHLEAHLLAPMLENPAPSFPFVACLVSGGHTSLLRVDGLGQYELLGETLDDAIGEAFDKTARLMGFSYPGGPKLAQLAERGDSSRFHFPRPMLDRPNMDFSFSGLKTFALNTWQSSDQNEQTKADIARAFQDAVVDVLVGKCQRALETTGLTQLVVAGGVSANTAIRAALAKKAAELGARVFYPRHEFCVDNGAMVAFAGCQRILRGEKSGLSVLVRPRWSLTELAN